MLHNFIRKNQSYDDANDCYDEGSYDDDYDYDYDAEMNDDYDAEMNDDNVNALNDWRDNTAARIWNDYHAYLASL